MAERDVVSMETKRRSIAYTDEIFGLLRTQLF
jgi:hypothetical protein